MIVGATWFSRMGGKHRYSNCQRLWVVFLRDRAVVILALRCDLTMVLSRSGALPASHGEMASVALLRPSRSLMWFAHANTTARSREAHVPTIDPTGSLSTQVDFAILKLPCRKAR